MAGIFDGPASAVYADPTVAAQAGPQQQQQTGLLGLIAAISKMRGQDPLGPQPGAQAGYSIPKIETAPQAPITPNQYQAPGFAPPIQPRIPNFDAVAMARAKLGLPPVGQQPAQSNPLEALINPSFLALNG